jgi:hypothetical protein
MGWLYGWHSPTEVRKHLREEIERSHTVLAERATAFSTHYWVLAEREHQEGGMRRIIFLFLIRGSKRAFGRGDYGYKDMDESMGPCYYDCPLDLIDMAGPPPNEYAATWREAVRAWHAKKRAKLALREGQLILLDFTGKFYRILKPQKRSWLMREVRTGKLWKLPPKQFGNVVTMDRLVGWMQERAARAAA